MVEREQKWTQMDTESIRHQPLAVLQVPQTHVREVWRGISCSYKGTSWQWLLMVDMRNCCSCTKKQAWKCLRALDFQTLPLAPLFIWILDVLKSPSGHLKSQPEESWELCGWTHSLPCPVPVPAWIRALFRISLCLLLLNGYVLSSCCPVLVPIWVQALSPLIPNRLVIGLSGFCPGPFLIDFCEQFKPCHRAWK